MIGGPKGNGGGRASKVTFNLTCKLVVVVAVVVQCSNTASVFSNLVIVDTTCWWGEKSIKTKILDLILFPLGIESALKKKI